MAKARILFIQEPDACCRFYRAVLKVADYTFVFAANPMQARELIQTQQFHRYVLASVVNSSSALELCEWLRESDLHTPSSSLEGAPHD